MARALVFTRAGVNWATFTTTEQGGLLFRASGYLVTDDGLQVPRMVDTLNTLSTSTRAAVETTIRLICFEIIAQELELTSGQGLVRDGTTFRLAAEGETPLWVKP